MTTLEDAWEFQELVGGGDADSLCLMDLRRRVEALEQRATPAPEPALAADRPLWAQMATTYDETPESPEDWAAVLDVAADWLEDKGYLRGWELLRAEARRAREGA